MTAGKNGGSDGDEGGPDAGKKSRGRRAVTVLLLLAWWGLAVTDKTDRPAEKAVTGSWVTTRRGRNTLRGALLVIPLLVVFSFLAAQLWKAWPSIGGGIEAFTAGATLVTVGSLVLNAGTLESPVRPGGKRVLETAAVIGGVIGVVPLVIVQGLGQDAGEVGLGSRIVLLGAGVGVVLGAGCFLERKHRGGPNGGQSQTSATPSST